MGGKQFDEVIHITAQIFAAPYADAGGAVFKQMCGIDGHQALIAPGLVGHGGQQADAQPQGDIGLDHIRVDGGQHHIGRQAPRLEGLVDQGAAGEGKVIGHDRIARQGLQGQRLFRQQGMVERNHDAAVPLIAGQRDQLGKVMHRFRGDHEVRLAGGRQPGHLGRITLLDAQAHPGIALGKGADGGGQNVARLGMGGGDAQRPGAFIRVLRPDITDGLRLTQDRLGQLDNEPARFGDAGQPLAAALKDLYLELFLQQAYLGADPRLGGV
ncbi:MAG: hypothetical protein A2V90_06785 [Gammaproteobacteria bacterium RBG_16_57_12]|nr:MAG: hypothetical protein A2V90_06785 [Gammaproteobacteria bacterium RBG_16_57_12]